MIRRSLAVVALVAPLALAGDKEWTPPKDGVLTEKQVDAYMVGSEKMLDLRDEYFKWLGEHKDANPFQLGERMKKFDAEFEKAKTDSGLEHAEWDWVQKEVQDIHMVWHVWTKSIKPDWDQKQKDADDKVAAAKKTADEVAAAKKSGRRVMTPEERADAKKGADDQAAAKESELKDAKEATANAQKALDEAKAAAKSADADAKADAEQAVKDKESALSEAKAAEAEAAKNVAAAKARAKDPDLPQTPEEKAENEKDLADREARAKEEFDRATKDRDMMREMYAKYEKEQFTAELKKHPAKNVELVKARDERLWKIFQRALGGKDTK